MPKAEKAKSVTATRAAGPIFDKTLGQHILKNPLVVNGIVDKVADPFDQSLIGQLIHTKRPL
jgi:18S rRNA (adenine1779-N6/adenine1780-N6)-dimethyltransferase